MEIDRSKLTTIQQFWKRAQVYVNLHYMWWGMILLGSGLRLYQYLLNRSFWDDEAALALNLANRNFAELTRLLDYHQAAPVGFLFMEKFFVLLLGNHDYVMRLFPLFSGLLGIYLIYKIARASFGTFGLFAVSLFSISWWLVYYASELKQYGSDVTVALLLVYLGMRCLRENAQGKDFLLLGITGATVIWISHPSVFIMVGVGLALVYEKLTRKPYISWGWIIGIGLGWLLSFGLEYLVSLRYIVADGYLIDYWRRTYVPVPPWSDKSWFRDTYYSFIFFAFHRADNLMALITLLLASVGLVNLVSRDRKLALLVISPFLITVVASALQRYPLKDRFMLFLVPFTLLLMAEGVRALYKLLSKWNSGWASFLCGLLTLAVIWQIVPVTFEKTFLEARDNVRPVLQYLAENRLPGDRIYVFYRTDTVFRYYAPFYGLDQGNIISGLNDPRKKIALQNYRNDVSGLTGNARVWFLFSGVEDCKGCPEEDTQSFYLQFIDQYGHLIDKFDGYGANLYLYDLSQ